MEHFITFGAHLPWDFHARALLSANRLERCSCSNHRGEPTQVQLPLGGAKEQIAVSAKAPLVQAENATLGRVIDRETVVNLPLVDRNFTDILGLTAGTNTDIVDATQLGTGSQEIHANGARSGDNNFMLNGADANSYSSNTTEVTSFGGAGIAIPAPDTMHEFKVQTSHYDAQYGRGSGAKVNVEIRSGTAIFMGMLVISAAMRRWAQTISLPTQPACQGENFGAHNPGTRWVDRCLGQRSAPFSSFPTDSESVA